METGALIVRKREKKIGGGLFVPSSFHIVVQTSEPATKLGRVSVSKGSSG